MQVNLEAIKEFVHVYNNTTQLAKEAGIDRSYIYRVLKGERPVSLRFINGMIKAGMKEEDIFIKEG